MNGGVQVSEINERCGPQIEGVQSIAQAVNSGKNVLVMGGAKWVVELMINTIPRFLTDPKIEKGKRLVTDKASAGKICFLGDGDFHEFVSGKKFDHWTTDIFWYDPPSKQEGRTA